jgi:hypothetical protein
LSVNWYSSCCCSLSRSSEDAKKVAIIPGIVKKCFLRTPVNPGSYALVRVNRRMSSNGYCWRTSQLAASGEQGTGMKQAFTSFPKNPYPSNTRIKSSFHVLHGRSK